MAIGPLAVGALLFAARSAWWGVPAADDYDYLYWLHFHRFTLLDAMGSLDYWRPLGRQLYYVTLSPVLFRAPWLVAVLHAGLLLLLYATLYRIARRAFAAPVAASIAAFPVLAEPLRALVVWPTGGEYLLALVFAALCVHEALAERPVTCALALLAALLSHEASGLAALAIPAIAWRRHGWAKRTWLWTGLAAGVLALWGVGHQLARVGGAGWLAAGTGGGSFVGKLGVALARTLVAQWNLEDAHGGVVTLIVAATALVFAVAAVLFVGDPVKLRRHRAAALGSLVWLLAGVASLALLLPDWNAWRTALPALWLGVATAGVLGAIRPWLAVALVGVRLAALLLAAPAPASIAGQPPQTTSGRSFARVVRLQQTADGVRRALVSHHPTLRPGALVRYWARPQWTGIAMVGDKAIRVWYDDSTLTWSRVWKENRILTDSDVVLGFDADRDPAVVVLKPAAIAAARLGNDALLEHEWGRADTLLALAATLQSDEPCYQFAAWTANRRALIALSQGDDARAVSFLDQSQQWVGVTADGYAIEAALALKAGDEATAIDRVRRCLALEPENAQGRYMLRMLEARRQPR